MLLMLRSKWSIVLTPVQRYASEPAELLSDALPDAHSPWRPMNGLSIPRAGADLSKPHRESPSIG